MKIKIAIGDKVFRADGCSGNVIQVYEPGVCPDLAIVRYDTLKTNVYTAPITIEDEENGFSDYYLIEKNFFGNKKEVAQIEMEIENLRETIRIEQLRLDQLRKQKWTLEERMVDNWKENRNKNRSS
ncbi:MAG: hypothetical protein IJ489_10755 [Clostridia bacterium]|nr:hypothetical protein [Clostridia bacterium]